MKFSQLPQQQHFTYNGQHFYKICPIYSSCCTVQYNATSEQSGHILLGEDIDVIPDDPNVQPIIIPEPPIVKAFSVSNLFTAGDKMTLRQIPMNSRFIAGDKIYKRVGADQVQDENGDIIKMNKNTPTELLEDIDEHNDDDDDDDDFLNAAIDDINEVLSADDDINKELNADIDDDEIYNGN